MVEIGDRAPDFTLFDMERKQRSLRDLRGRKVVIAFFPGAFTSTCKKEMCAIRDDITKLEKLRADIVAISVSDPFALKDFHEDNALNFPLLSDYTRETTRTYGIELHDFAGMKGYTVAKRSIFLLDEEGIIRWKWVSDNPGVEPDYGEILHQLEKF